MSYRETSRTIRLVVDDHNSYRLTVHGREIGVVGGSSRDIIKMLMMGALEDAVESIADELLDGVA